MHKCKINKLAVLAGSGTLPYQVCLSAKEQGIDFIVIGLAGEVEVELFTNMPITIIPTYQVSKIIAYLHEHKVTDVVMAGYVSRADVFRLLKDWQGAKLLATILRTGLSDNSIFSAVINYLEKAGFNVIGADVVAKENIVSKGLYTKKKLTDNVLADIKQGFKVLKVVAEEDIGQALVIQSGLILGIEAAEGTDELLRRCGAIKQTEGDGPILVKMAKPTQDVRVDLPCIGPKTVEIAAQFGFEGIAVDAGQTIIIEEEKTVKLANKLGLFIYGY